MWHKRMNKKPCLFLVNFSSSQPLNQASFVRFRKNSAVKKTLRNPAKEKHQQNFEPKVNLSQVYINKKVAEKTCIFVTSFFPLETQCTTGLRSCACQKVYQQKACILYLPLIILRSLTSYVYFAQLCSNTHFFDCLMVWIHLLNLNWKLTESWLNL